MAKKPLTVTELARMGGKARAKKLSPEQRTEIAKKAVQAREAKRAAKTTIGQERAVKQRAASVFAHRHGANQGRLIGSNNG